MGWGRLQGVGGGGCPEGSSRGYCKAQRGQRKSGKRHASPPPVSRPLPRGSPVQQGCSSWGLQVSQLSLAGAGMASRLLDARPRSGGGRRRGAHFCGSCCGWLCW